MGSVCRASFPGRELLCHAGGFRSLFFETGDEYVNALRPNLFPKYQENDDTNRYSSIYVGRYAILVFVPDLRYPTILKLVHIRVTIGNFQLPASSSFQETIILAEFKLLFCSRNSLRHLNYGF
jgi:hypothetical protein